MHEKKGEWKRKHAGRIVGAAILALLVLILLVHFLSDGGKNAATREDRMAFLAALGWEADPETEQTNSVRIPDCSEGAMADYNALMRKGGYDLSDYEGKSAEQYQYILSNYPDCSQAVWGTGDRRRYPHGLPRRLHARAAAKRTKNHRLSRWFF